MKCLLDVPSLVASAYSNVPPQSISSVSSSLQSFPVWPQPSDSIAGVDNESIRVLCCLINYKNSLWIVIIKILNHIITLHYFEAPFAFSFPFFVNVRSFLSSICLRVFWWCILPSLSQLASIYIYNTSFVRTAQ